MRQCMQILYSLSLEEEDVWTTKWSVAPFAEFNEIMERVMHLRSQRCYRAAQIRHASCQERQIEHMHSVLVYFIKHRLVHIAHSLHKTDNQSYSAAACKNGTG